MASSLVKTDQSSSLKPLTPVQQKIAEVLAEGYELKVVARKLAKGDLKEARKWREKIRRWMRDNPSFQLAVYGAYRSEMALHLGPGIKGLGKRAARGRVDANKLIMEATGFHNPRVQHEHSGEVKVTLSSMPRPKQIDSTSGDPIVDAEVVDD